MYKVLLADYDDSSMKLIREYINASHLNLKIVKEVKDGNQALSIIEQEDIDLVICELRLPSLSGYHLFKKIEYSKQNTKMILYSSFDEYEHLQKAQAEGVLDYIYKPVKQKEFIQLLTQACKVLDELSEKEREEKAIAKEYEQMLYLFKDRFLINLIHGHLEDEDNIKEDFKYFGITLDNSYTVLLIKIDFYKKLSLVYDEKEKELFMFRLTNKLEEKLKSVGNNSVSGVTFINNYDEITVILGNIDNIEDIVLIAEELRQMAKLETVTTVSIGIGRTQSKAKLINISYKQAKAALRYIYHIGNDSVIHIDYVEPQNHITYNYPLNKEELLVYEAVIGNKERVMKLADELQQALESCGEMPKKLLPKIVLDIVVSISRYSSEQNIIIEDVLSEFFSTKELLKLDKMEDAFGYLKKILDNICTHVNKLRLSKENEIFEAAKAYIAENYMENMSLINTAIKLNVTPHYLDKLFRDNEGLSFKECINRMRLNEAKKLLLETELNGEEIALRVGYSDRKHFEYMFLQGENISATDFRNLNKAPRFISNIKNPYTTN